MVTKNVAQIPNKKSCLKCLLSIDFLGKKNTPNNKKIKIKILPKSKYRCIKTAMFFKNLAILGKCHNPSQEDPGYVCNQPFVVNLHKIKITPGRAAIK